MTIDLQKVAEALIIALTGGAITWLFGTVIQLKRDMDAAHAKLRDLQDANR